MTGVVPAPYGENEIHFHFIVSAWSPTASPSEPFAACELRSLRLLVGYALVAEEAALARGALLRWLPPGPLAPLARTCAALPALVAAAREGSGPRFALDAALGLVLDTHAQPYRMRRTHGLAELWMAERRTLAGPPLAALLWRLARDGHPALRPLERRVAAATEPERLLDLAQRTALGCAGAARPHPEPARRSHAQARL